MIITWMLGSMLLGAIIALGAMAAEGAMHSLGRARRWPWMFALAASTVWPLAAGAVFVVSTGDSAPTVIRESLPPPPQPSAVRAIASQMPHLSAFSESVIARYMIVLWALTSVALLARLAVGLLRLRQVGRTGTTLDVDGLRVHVTESLGPAVYGAWHPRIVVPRWLLDLDAPLRTLVLAHEEEHRERGDAAVIVVAVLATAVVPWNPVVWWIARRVRLVVEIDCDSRVLASHGDAHRYGKLLVLIAQRQSTTTLVPMLAESNAHLKRRIEAMNGISTRSVARATALGVVAVAAGAFACSNSVMSDVTAPKPISASKLSGLPQGEQVFFEFQVTKPVRSATNTVHPRYPDILKSAGVEGEVLVQFVVDENGLPVTGSLKILKTTHELFAVSVRAAFSGMRFTPAEIDGRKVKQLVQQPFVFEIAESVRR